MKYKKSFQIKLNAKVIQQLEPYKVFLVLEK